MFETVYDRLLEQHGPQGWWPAQDRFEIIAGAVLVQRTAWRNAAQAIERLRQADALTPERLVTLSVARLETLIKPAGFYRVKAKRLKALADFIITTGGLAALDRLPAAALRRLFLERPGIGPETADAILGYAFRRPVFVVDAYARRLFERVGFEDADTSARSLQAGCEAALSSVDRLNELHALIVVHCQRYCAVTPQCSRCLLRPDCGYAAEAASRSA